MLYKTNNYILLTVDQSELTESLLSPNVQSLIGRSLLIHCLKEAGVYNEYPVYSYGPFNKPYLSNYPGRYFNISHCVKAVVCTLSLQEIGVDVEVIDADNLELMSEVLNDVEINNVVDSNDPKRTFCQYWTKKESLLKCSGAGISTNLKNVLNQDKYEFHQFSKVGYEICVCVNKLTSESNSY